MVRPPKPACCGAASAAAFAALKLAGAAYSWRRTRRTRRRRSSCWERFFIFDGTLRCLGVAAVAAKTAGRIALARGVGLWINRALGGLFVYLGIRIALFQARSL